MPGMRVIRVCVLTALLPSAPPSWRHPRSDPLGLLRPCSGMEVRVLAGLGRSPPPRIVADGTALQEGGGASPPGPGYRALRWGRLGGPSTGWPTPLPPAAHPPGGPTKPYGTRSREMALPLAWGFIEEEDTHEVVHVLWRHRFLTRASWSGGARHRCPRGTRARRWAVAHARCEAGADAHDTAAPVVRAHGGGPLGASAVGPCCAGGLPGTVQYVLRCTYSSGIGPRPVATRWGQDSWRRERLIEEKKKRRQGPLRVMPEAQ